MTIAIAALAGVLYWFGYYTWSFLVVAYAILANVVTAIFATSIRIGTIAKLSLLMFSRTLLRCL
jgi:hypothetical protein